MKKTVIFFIILILASFSIPVSASDDVIKGDVLYQNDFSSPDLKGMIAGAGWVIQNGVLEVPEVSGTDCYYMPTDAKKNWTDYAIEADYKLTGGDHNVGLHFLFNGTDDYVMLIRSRSWSGYSSKNVLEIYKILDNKSSSFAYSAHYVNGAVDIEDNTWIHIKVNIIGNSIKVFMNDQLIIDRKDGKRISFGGFGFNCSNSTVQIDNVKAYKISAKPDDSSAIVSRVPKMELKNYDNAQAVDISVPLISENVPSQPPVKASANNNIYFIFGAVVIVLAAGAVAAILLIKKNRK